MKSILSPQELYYLLGYGFYEFNISPKKIYLQKNNAHSHFLEVLEDWFGEEMKFSDESSSIVISNEEVVKFITNSINSSLEVPLEMRPHFISGYFEGYGSLRFEDGTITLSLRQGLVDHILKEQYSFEGGKTTGYKALDVMGQIISHRPFESSNGYFLDVLNKQETTREIRDKTFAYHKLSDRAIAPQKHRFTDSGYDLHVVELTKLYTTYFGAEVYKAKTYLSVEPSFGQAFDLAGRSSLPDKGWQLLQGVGIIDRSFTGQLQATLMKLSSDPLPELPWRCLQLVPRKSPIHLPFIEKDKLGESDRGAGGFGSTGG